MPMEAYVLPQSMASTTDGISTKTGLFARASKARNITFYVLINKHPRITCLLPFYIIASGRCRNQNAKRMCSPSHEENQIIICHH